MRAGGVARGPEAVARLCAPDRLERIAAHQRVDPAVHGVLGRLVGGDPADPARTLFGEPQSAVRARSNVLRGGTRKSVIVPLVVIRPTLPPPNHRAPSGPTVISLA
jgi:hypothetical protein